MAEEPPTTIEERQNQRLQELEQDETQELPSMEEIEDQLYEEIETRRSIPSMEELQRLFQDARSLEQDDSRPRPPSISSLSLSSIGDF